MRERLALGLILVAAVWIHHGALRAPFFADDYLFLDRMPGRSLLAAVTSPDPIGNYFRPLGRQIWFWTLSTLSGSSPAAFHAANLGLFLVAITLLHSIVRRAAGPWAALIAASLLAVQHAADVPVLWASGSQDLLAVVGALSALRLVQAGHPGWAALPFAMGLLSKESVVMAPLVAIALDRRPSERWTQAARRGWPLLATLVVWGAVVAMLAARRPLLGLETKITPSDVLAVPVHLLQTVAGIEWAHDGFSRVVVAMPPLALFLVVAGLAWAWRAAARRQEPGARKPTWAIGTGVLWAVLGALPVVMVSGIWSAYYFLFAVCGAALALGAAVASRPRWAGVLLVFALGWTAQNARRLPEFATARNPWSPQSHVNRHYLERGMAAVSRYLEDLRRLRPTLPPATTLFFTRIPGQVAFQSGDGPLVRWAYRDTSLRSYFLTRFRLAHARRGPVFFFQASNDSLVEVSGADSLQRIGVGLVLSNAPEAARDALQLAWEKDPLSGGTAYRLGLLEMRLGRMDSAKVWLERSGARTVAGPSPQTSAAMERLAAGDTAGAFDLARGGVVQHALDPGAHAVLSDLLLARYGLTDAAILEAYAACVLGPDLPSSWRRWGMIALLRERHGEAKEALERYFALAGPAGRNDRDAVRALEETSKRLPGGALAQEAVRKVPGSR